mgnify:CR=1 FL=1
MEAIGLAVQVVTLAVVVYAARKAYWAVEIGAKNRERIRQESVNATRQTEHLAVLYRKLDLEPGSLPPTRGWAASPDFLNVLHDHVVDHEPGTVVECGSGLSTLVVARAFQQRGHGMLLSLDHDPRYAHRTSSMLQELGLEGWARVALAPLAPIRIGERNWSWYDLSAVDLPESVDLIVVDGPPSPLVGPRGRYPVGAQLFGRLSDRGVVLLDDAARAGEKRVIEDLLREFPQLEAKDYACEKGCTGLARRATGAGESDEHAAGAA